MAPAEISMKSYLTITNKNFSIPNGNDAKQREISIATKRPMRQAFLLTIDDHLFGKGAPRTASQMSKLSTGMHAVNESNKLIFPGLTQDALFFDNHIGVRRSSIFSFMVHVLQSSKPTWAPAISVAEILFDRAPCCWN